MTFLLATAFTLAGTPAEAAALASTNNHNLSMSTDADTHCAGQTPGSCPGRVGIGVPPIDIPGVLDNALPR
jgi:hypothetical protein